MTRVAGGTTGEEEKSKYRVYHWYSLGEFGNLGLHKLAQSDILTLYLVFEDTRYGPKPEKRFKFVVFESENFSVQYKVRPTRGKEMFLVESFPVRA